MRGRGSATIALSASRPPNSWREVYGCLTEAVNQGCKKKKGPPDSGGPFWFDFAARA
jgi:hypothetical protein